MPTPTLKGGASRRRQAERDVTSAGTDEEAKLQAALDQLADKLSKPEYAEDTELN
jgi:hypothetical protein